MMMSRCPPKRSLRAGPRAAIRNVGGLDPGDRVEQLGRDVHRGARPRRSVAHRSAFGLSEQVSEARDFRLRADHEERGHHADEHDGGERLDRIVTELRAQRGAQHVRAEARLQQRLAVGRGFRHQLGADDATRAAAVFDDDLGVETRRQFVRDGAGHEIDRPAGREWHHEPDLISRNGRQRRCEQERRSKQACHGEPPLPPADVAAGRRKPKNSELSTNMRRRVESAAFLRH
jgi:hypothetical protein